MLTSFEIWMCLIMWILFQRLFHPTHSNTQREFGQLKMLKIDTTHQYCCEKGRTAEFYLKDNSGYLFQSGPCFPYSSFMNYTLTGCRPTNFYIWGSAVLQYNPLRTGNMKLNQKVITTHGIRYANVTKVYYVHVCGIFKWMLLINYWLLLLLVIIILASL